MLPVDTPAEGPSGSDPKEPPVGINTSRPTTENHTPADTLENTSEDASGDSIMKFMVQNFEHINDMQSAFCLKRKEINPTSQFNNDDLPGMGPWISNPEGLPKGVAQ
ncbi:hypothetical protein Tco_1405376 [Tanacetum coccineum]